MNMRLFWSAVLPIAYVGLGYRPMCLVGIPHSGTECRTLRLEQSNSVFDKKRDQAFSLGL